MNAEYLKMGFAILIVGVAQVIGAPLPAQLRANLTAALEATTKHADLSTRVPFTFQDAKERWSQGSLFNEALDRLALQIDQQAVTEAAHERTIEEKFIVIAHDRKTRPGDYVEIEKTYVDATEVMRSYEKTDAWPRAILSPNPKPEHLTDKYRLVWEYVYLRPLITNTFELHGRRAREALAKINNDKSITTLMHSFKMTLGRPASRSGAARDQQRGALAAIAAFQTEKGLEALLQCVDLTASQPKRIEDEQEDYDVEKLVTDRLTSKENPADAAKWKLVVQAYSAKESALPEKQRRFLQRVNDTLARDSNP